MRVDGPGPVPADALHYFRAKVNLPGFDYRDIWREEHASAFTVAKAVQADVLTSIREALDDALAQGKTFRQFAKELTPELQRLGWWGKGLVEDPVTGETVAAQLGSPRRLKTIYRANLATARSAGQWARAQRTKKALPYFLYELGPSREHREEHAAWAGTLLLIDDPWWNTHMPRNGWGCKCRVRQVSRVEAKRLITAGKVRTDAPEVKRAPWENKRTGQVEMVPEGIDPGWDTNPGKVRQQSLEKLLAGKLDASTPEVLAAAVKDLAVSGRFGGWVDDVLKRGQAAGRVQIVGMVDDAVKRFLDAKGVRLSSRVIDIDDKGLLHSRRTAKTSRDAAISLADLRNLPERLLTAERLWDRNAPALVFAFDAQDTEGKKGKAVVRINYMRKGQVSNRVVTTGLVQPENLTGEHYERIEE